MATGATAQRHTDKLDRALVAVPSGQGNFVSWKIFGEEYYDTQYNLYCDGVKLNPSPLSVSNFQHGAGTSASKYQVAPVVRGVEQAKCDAVMPWAAQYKDVTISGVVNRAGANVTSKYEINDISLGDVDGDGTPEFIIKRNNTSGNLNTDGNKTEFNLYECYTVGGQRLWWIDLGPNLMAGPDEQWDLVAYDWDEDGRAECVMRGVDNMIIHTATGHDIEIGNMNYYAPRSEYTFNGAEYLLYLNGATGEPYGWDGQTDKFTPMTYPLPRFEQGESDYATVWGKADTGHRSCKHYFGAPFLDGRHASIFLGRGCYTRHKFCALDVNPATHELTQRWRWNEYDGSSPYFGQGYHNFQIADVDWDGRDEIMFGSMVIDDNGLGLCTTGLGHGDAQHCSDLDPYRHGQEQFVCNETSPSCTYYNATTGKIYYRLQGTSDDGRALAGNFSNQFPGSMGRSTASGLISMVADKIISSGGPATDGSNDALYWSHLNQRIYWDGDLLDEVFDSPGSDARNGAVYKPGGGRLITFEGTNTANSSKNNPGALADILGDWREEVVMRSGTQGSTTIRIFTTTTPTNFGIYTLWHDHQYRNAMVWQCVGYNQPPHKSYFLGQLEGITTPPPPLTMTGRTEVANGGTIGSNLDGEHVIVCEMNDTKVTVADGAKPYIATFYVPSWVQGTNSKLLNGAAKINYTYYTCNVEGGAFAGSMRLVKQGDGILSLPKVDMLYTGETNIWAGTVNFDGTMRSSSVWLNRFAELNSDGGTFRSIKLDYDAKLRPGRADNCGTITTDTLAMGFGSRVIFDIYNDGLQADQVNTKLLSIEKKGWTYGPKYLTPIFEFVCHTDEGADPAAGKYLLGTVETLKGSLGDLRIEGIGTKLKSELVIEDGKLYLVISGTRDAGAVTWIGSVSNVWDMAGVENFANSEGGSDIFVSGDNVTFNDDALKISLTLAGDIEADTVFVDSNRQYTFSGTGSLVGGTTLVKRGTGMLTIRTDNSYTGGNHFEGGRVSVSSLANANQAKGNLGAVVTNANLFTMQGGAELYTTAAVTNGSPIKFIGDEGGVINCAQDFIVNKSMQGTLLTKKGTGTMRLNVNNGALNRLVIAAGTVQCISATTPAKTVEFQSGALNENGGTSYSIIVPEGKSGTWSLANRSTYSNKITGAGNLTINCVCEKGSNYYATRTQVACDFSNFEGTIIPKSSNDPDGRFTMNSSKGMPNGTMNIGAGVVVQNHGLVFRIGRIMGTGSLGGSCTFSNNESVGANTWQVGNDDDWTSNNKVTANAIFTKVGNGTVTWNGANDNTGATNISAGELQLGTSALLGTGRLTVGKNGTLSCKSTTKALTNSATTVEGTLAVTATGCATATNAGCTTFNFSKALTINGTISIKAAHGHTLQVGDSIRIFTAASFAGKPTIVSNYGIEWDDSRLAEGLLFVKAIDTAIDSIISDRTPRNIYDTRGRLVRSRATSTEGLPAGIYVCEGRKFVVK